MTEKKELAQRLYTVLTGKPSEFLLSFLDYQNRKQGDEKRLCDIVIRCESSVKGFGFYVEHGKIYMDLDERNIDDFSVKHSSLAVDGQTFFPQFFDADYGNETIFVNRDMLFIFCELCMILTYPGLCILEQKNINSIPKDRLVDLFCMDRCLEFNELRVGTVDFGIGKLLNVLADKDLKKFCCNYDNRIREHNLFSYEDERPVLFDIE